MGVHRKLHLPERLLLPLSNRFCTRTAMHAIQASEQLAGATTPTVTWDELTPVPMRLR